MARIKEFRFWWADAWNDIEKGYDTILETSDSGYVMLQCLVKELEGHMNKNQMHQIFKHYIDNFEMLNNNVNAEYYKWQICAVFKPLMDEALQVSPSEFANALYKVKECSANIIDSYTQPFYGLVEYARREPETVQQMIKDLYSDDGGDVQIQMKLIKDFFDKSNHLLDKYFPDSYLYKQNSHSVSSYLFLYDPDHHYMYKATQSQVMADCIEFYDDWGT